MAMEKFHYSLVVGEDDEGDPIKRKLTLVKFNQIKFGLIRKNRKLPQEEQFFALLEAILSDEDLEAIDEATQESIMGMMTEWQKDSGIEMGESPAS